MATSPTAALLLASGALLLPSASASGQTAQTPGQPSPSIESTSDATSVPSAKAQGGIGLLAGVPVGPFGNSFEAGGTRGKWRPWNWGDAIAGLSANLSVGLGDSIFSVGGEAAYLWYGEESRRVPLSTTIPDLTVTVTTDNAMFLLHARMRAQRRTGRWRPYVDGLIGLSDIFTKTSIDESFTCNGNFGCGSALESTNLRDVVPSWGGGAGVMIGSSTPNKPRFDFSVRYLKGGEANYLQQGAIRREDGQAFLDITHSRTDMVEIYIGVALGR